MSQHSCFHGGGKNKADFLNGNYSRKHSINSKAVPVEMLLQIFTKMYTHTHVRARTLRHPSVWQWARKTHLLWLTRTFNSRWRKLLNNKPSYYCQNMNRNHQHKAEANVQNLSLWRMEALKQRVLQRFACAIKNIQMKLIENIWTDKDGWVFHNEAVWEQLEGARLLVHFSNESTGKVWKVLHLPKRCVCTKKNACIKYSSYQSWLYTVRFSA